VGWFQKMLFPHFNFRLNLHGTTRFLSTDHFAPKNLYLYAAKEALKNALRRMAGGNIKPLSYTYYYASYFRELQCFFEGIQRDDIPNPLASLVDGLEAIRIIEESYKFANRMTGEIRCSARIDRAWR